MKRLIARVVAGLFGVAMLGCLIGGVAVLAADHDLTAHHLTAQGSVTEISGTADTIQMRIAFTTKQGRRISVWVDGDDHSHVGDTVTVQYSPDDPKVARVGHGMLMQGVAMTVLGLLGTIASGYGVFGARKSTNRSAAER